MKPVTKQVSLSNEAYAKLKAEKATGESFSDVVVRLLGQARMGKKDPMRFVNHPHEFLLAMDEHLAMVDEGREADRNDPWQAERAGTARTRKRPGKRASGPTTSGDP